MHEAGRPANGVLCSRKGFAHARQESKSAGNPLPDAGAYGVRIPPKHKNDSPNAVLSEQRVYTDIALKRI